MVAFLVVLAVLFFGGLYLITELQKTNPCLNAVTSCAYNAIKPKANGIQLDFSDPNNALITIVLTIGTILLAVFVASLIYSALHNKPASKPHDRWGKLPYWLDDKGQSTVLVSLFLLSFIGLVAFAYILTNNAQVRQAFNDFTLWARYVLSQIQLLFVKMGGTF